MPFKSKKQEKWAFATKQPFAKKWADMTTQAGLPMTAPTVGAPHPMIPMSPAMMTSIKNAPKGKIPPGLARYLAQKKAMKGGASNG